MERDTIQQHVGFLRGEIAVLQQENLSIRNLIDRLENDEVSISVLDNKINIFISECIDALNHTTHPAGNYADILKGILTGSDVKNLCDNAKALAVRIREEINTLEETIKSNNLKICRYQVDIDEVEAVKAEVSFHEE